MEGDREIAQFASVLGREFRHELLAAAALTDEDTLRAELTKLVQGEILHQRGRPPSCSYVFRHALLQDAAYNSLTRARKQEFHARVATLLEGQFADTVRSHPEILAYHFEQSGNSESAVKYYLVAGYDARSRSAEAEAIQHLENGLKLLRTLPDSEKRSVQELKIRSLAGTAYIASRGYGAPEVGPNFQRARELCEQIGESQQLFAVLWGTWVWHLVRGELEPAMDFANQCLALADRMGDPGMMMEALFPMSVTHAFKGEFRLAYKHSELALSQYDNRDRTRHWASITGEDSGVAHRCYHAVALWHLGDPIGANNYIEDAVALARQIAQPFTLNFALEHLAWLSIQSRQAERAIQAAEEEIALSTEQGYAYWVASASLFKADALVLQGKSEEALPLLQHGIEQLKATGAELDLTLHFGFLGRAYFDVGDYNKSLESLNEALAIAGRSGERFDECELYRLKGELLRHSGLAEEAERHFRGAIAIARLQESKAMELRCSTSFATLLRDKGKLAEARTLVTNALKGFPPNAAGPDLQDATTLLAQL
jgi:tetratricopeptide (TPR) repeat protein